MQIGFIGLGLMGQPMVLNLAKAGIPLTLWNRSSSKYEGFSYPNVQIAASPEAVFEQAEIIFLMLANAQVIDTVLKRNTPAFQQNVAKRIIVTMGTTAPEYSRQLEQDIKAADGGYVEAPVSGSKKPAEAGTLVAMVAGESKNIARIRPFLEPMCKDIFLCGAVPNALSMKLAVNVFLISMVTGLAESFHFAQQQNLDVKQLQAILDEGPMASEVSRLKAAKLANQDYTAQASILDVFMNNRLIVEAAKSSQIAAPLLEVCFNLYAETEQLGHGQSDMIAVIQAIQNRTVESRT